MSSASSSTVTAYNARWHSGSTPTQSTTRLNTTARGRGTASSVAPGEEGAAFTGASTTARRSPGSYSGTETPRAGSVAGGPYGGGEPSKRVPITPAVLRDIFASSRTLIEERAVSRVAFFRRDRFAGFLLSCLGISLAAARGRPVPGLGLNR
ncbi:hypothetical protein DL93DRAFT_2141509 [Clavulina sp. PMI_390]|nr:hypothetical protein DL93DRAFT_2141509 [Clavulina sp. PMI_390]